MQHSLFFVYLLIYALRSSLLEINFFIQDFNMIRTIQQVNITLQRKFS